MTRIIGGGARVLLSSSLLCGALSLGALGVAEAARFGVRVIDAGGEPVAGASVCVGLEGNYRQFGTAFTDADGVAALLDVPNVPFIVTVSKSRFAGVRRSEPAQNYDLVREITLESGRPGPRCKAGSTVAEIPSSIRVSRIDVLASATMTLLTPAVSGEPSHYRVASDESFAGADWQRFERDIALPGSLAEEPSVYLQLRRFAGSSRGWLEARSDVVAVQLPPR